MQVQNLRRHASPFGQGFKLVVAYSKFIQVLKHVYVCVVNQVVYVYIMSVLLFVYLFIIIMITIMIVIIIIIIIIFWACLLVLFDPFHSKTFSQE